MAGRALTPATRLRLGGPLPRQLPDRTIAAPKAPKLSSEEHMGYYRRFPAAIPHLGVRSIVLLTLPPLTLAGPFDLHALCTPPAFNLSQDQTLQLIICVRDPLAENTVINKSFVQRSPPKRRTGLHPSPNPKIRPRMPLSNSLSGFSNSVRGTPPRLPEASSARESEAMCCDTRPAVGNNARPAKATRTRVGIASHSRDHQLFTCQGFRPDKTLTTVSSPLPAPAVPRFGGRGYGTTRPSDVNMPKRDF